MRPYLIHTFDAAPMPCSDHAVLLKATAHHGRLSMAIAISLRKQSSILQVELYRYAMYALRSAAVQRQEHGLVIFI